MASTEIPSHAQRMQLYQDTVLLNTKRLTLRSFSPGFISDLIAGSTSALAEDTDYRSLQRHLSTFFGNAEGSDLDDLAFDHFQLTRFGGGGAIGIIQFSRPNTSFGPVTIPALTQIATVGDVRFLTLEEVLLTTTTQLADIQCGLVGEEGIVGPGTITVLLSQLDDTSITVTNPERTAGGSGRESDSDFRERIRGFLQTLRRGTRSALIFGAKLVGVQQAAIEETSATLDAYIAGVSSTTPDAEVNGAWIAKSTTLSAKLILSFTAVLSNNETVTLAANLQDATSSGGAGSADFGPAISGQVLVTAPGSGGPHTLSGQFEQVFDLTTARAFLRSQQTLATSSTGTVIWSAGLELQGLESVVRVYVSDASGTANTALLDAVEAELENWRAAGILLDVLAAAVVSQAINLSITFRAGTDTQTARDAVLRAVVDEVNRLSIGETLFRSRLVTAAGATQGVLNVVVNNPVGDVTPAVNQLIRTAITSVTFS